ncbi:MAG: hypothetical protein SFV23_16920 [Planctomycetaceae bacterium]|nr:hypothetical protein [Planctomycetaceae bacterium]
MNINLVIPDQVEAVLRRKAATLGQELSEYLQRVAAEDAEADWPTPPHSESPDAFMVRLREMVRRHAVRCGHVDDSRESIYAGCGE